MRSAGCAASATAGAETTAEVGLGAMWGFGELELAEPSRVDVRARWAPGESARADRGARPVEHAVGRAGRPPPTT